MSASFTVKGTFKTRESLKRYSSFKNTIPSILAVNTVNHFKKGFSTSGGQTDRSRSGWRSRQFTRGVGSRNTLVKTGTLQRDIQKKSVKFNQIIVGTTNLTIDYAEMHNNGGVIRLTEQMRKFFWAQYYKTKEEYYKNLALHKGSFIKIPQREFVGNSQELEKKNELLIIKNLDKVFKL